MDSWVKKMEDNSEGSEESLPSILRFFAIVPARLDCRSVASGYSDRHPPPRLRQATTNVCPLFPSPIWILTMQKYPFVMTR